MKTIRIILHSNQGETRIKKLLDLIKSDKGSYSYYKDNNLYYIMVDYDDLFPYYNLDDFFKSLKYNMDDEIIILDHNNKIFSNNKLKWVHSEVSYKPLEVPSGSVFKLKMISAFDEI